MTDAFSRATRRTIGMPVWILIGGALGILAGVVFGERTAILEPIGSAYSMLLQIAIYPYLLPPHARSLQEYLDQWLILHDDDGFREEQVAYWLEGKPRTVRQRRWNLLDALLGSRAAQAAVSAAR